MSKYDTYTCGSHTLMHLPSVDETVARLTEIADVNTDEVYTAYAVFLEEQDALTVDKERAVDEYNAEEMYASRHEADQFPDRHPVFAVEKEAGRFLVDWDDGSFTVEKDNPFVG